MLPGYREGKCTDLEVVFTVIYTCLPEYEVISVSVSLLQYARIF